MQNIDCPTHPKTLNSAYDPLVNYILFKLFTKLKTVEILTDQPIIKLWIQQYSNVHCTKYTMPKPTNQTPEAKSPKHASNISSEQRKKSPRTSFTIPKTQPRGSLVRHNPSCISKFAKSNKRVDLPWQHYATNNFQRCNYEWALMAGTRELSRSPEVIVDEIRHSVRRYCWRLP